MAATLEQCLRESVQLSRTDLEYLQDWLKKQPHLPPIEDVEVASFLHSNDYSLERTKVCIDKFFTMRTHAPEIFGNRDITLEVNSSQSRFFIVADLPKRDSKDYCVVFLGLQAANDLTDFVPTRSAFLSLTMMEMIVREQPMVPGYSFIMDAKNLQIGHLTKSSVTFLHKLLTFVQEAVPLRMKEVHVININSVVEKVMLLIRPFLGQELQKMLHFHSGAMRDFYEYLPKETLFSEYGGSAGSALDRHRENLERLKRDGDLVLAQEAQRVDESLRPGRAKSEGDVYGVEGSFKRLDID